MFRLKSVSLPEPERRRRLWMGAASVAYLLLIVIVLTILRFGAERWWPATLILFGPRWIFALPLLALIPAALVIYRPSLWVLGAAIYLLLFPVLDFRVPWPVMLSREPAGLHLRILTCNRHRYALITSEMAEFIARTKPDIVVMQEFTAHDEQDLFGVGRWYFERDGELFLASRYPIELGEDIVQGAWGPSGAAAYYKIDVAGRSVNIINLHLASPHLQFDDAVHGAPDGPEEVQENSGQRMDQSIMVANFAKGLKGPVLLAGDFNTPRDSPIFEEAWLGFTDGFSYAGWGVGNTFHTHWSSSGIDHVLAAGGIRFEACRVGPNVGSPHRPVVADVVIPQ